MGDTASNVTSSCDVLVVGAGTAGITAAIQAARAGAKTAVIEMSGQPGGTMANSVATWPGYFHAWGRRVIGGIGWELVKAAKALTHEKLPDPLVPPTGLPDHQIHVNAHAYALLAEEAMLQAGVSIHYHETATGVDRPGSRWRVTSSGKNLTRVIQAKELIDCTGDADLVGMLGLPREREATRQPGTLRFRFCGYDLHALDFTEIERRYAAAMAEGVLRPGDFSGMEDSSFSLFLKRGGMNQQHLYGADSTTADRQSQANIDGRQSMLRMLRFVQGLPGCGQTTIQWMAPMTAIRETYRIVGETKVTREDYCSGRDFADAISYSIFLVDWHGPDGGTVMPLAEGTVPTVPFSALIPKGTQNLLVAGRCLASDPLANSGLRVQPSCMAMGQAVGAAAALAVQQGIASREVNLAALGDLLRQHGAIVPAHDHRDDARSCNCREKEGMPCN